MNLAFNRLEEGYENALKDYYKKQVTQFNLLINLLLGDMSKAERQRIMTVCTIDVFTSIQGKSIKLLVILIQCNCDFNVKERCPIL